MRLPARLPVASRDYALVVRAARRMRRETPRSPSVPSELLRLTLLEPAIIQSILAGQQPRCMSLLLWFQRSPLPADWVAQREVVAGFDA